LITQLTTTARAATTTTATKAAATTITMTLSYSLILAFVGIAETTLAFVPFKNRYIVRSEVRKYCDDPAKYDKSVYGPIKDWDVSALTTMMGLFSPMKGSSKGLFKKCPNCSTCNPPVSNWNVSSVENFGYMFYGADAFNQDLSGWDVGKGSNFDGMFKGSGMNHYIGDWPISIPKIGDDVCENQLSVISSMLVAISSSTSWYKDLTLVEKQQFINLITPKKISKDVN